MVLSSDLTNGFLHTEGVECWYRGEKVGGVEEDVLDQGVLKQTSIVEWFVDILYAFVPSWMTEMMGSVFALDCFSPHEHGVSKLQSLDTLDSLYCRSLGSWLYVQSYNMDIKSYFITI